METVKALLVFLGMFFCVWGVVNLVLIDPITNRLDKIIELLEEDD